jgi:hypothetical protein
MTDQAQQPAADANPAPTAPAPTTQDGGSGGISREVALQAVYETDPNR